jgi:DNA-binding MarR family transcriptional regulator
MGITVHEFQVLRAITYLRGTVTPTTITNLLDKNPNYVTLLLNRMQKEGLIERKKDMDDRRSIRIVMTLLGEKKFKASITPAIAVRTKLLSTLSQKEIVTLIGILQKISDQTFAYRNIKDKMIDLSV